MKDSLHALLNGVEVCTGGDIVILALLAACKSKILGHNALLVDNVNTSLLERLGKLDDLGSVVELTTLGKTTGPGEDGGDGVGGGGVSFLVLAVVARDGAVRGFGLRRSCRRG